MKIPEVDSFQNGHKQSHVILGSWSNIQDKEIKEQIKKAYPKQVFDQIADVRYTYDALLATAIPENLKDEVPKS